MMITEQKFRVPSTYESLHRIEKLVEEVCEENQLGEDYYGNILVAVTEAVNNAIQHGNKSNPAKSIEVTCRLEGSRLFFTVSDEGEGFDYSNIPDPTDPRNIEKINGRGVFLMKNLADAVVFTDNGRKVELDFNVSHSLVN